MVRDPKSTQMTVDEAKARLRLAAAQAEPAVMMEGAIRRSPWSAVGAMVVAGLIIGASPTARRALGSVAVMALQAVRPR
jgi:ElaB/YqjD/DUF883 family membrane-anchored ribosome-binding protein